MWSTNRVVRLTMFSEKKMTVRASVRATKLSGRLWRGSLQARFQSVYTCIVTHTIPHPFAIQSTETCRFCLKVTVWRRAIKKPKNTTVNDGCVGPVYLTNSWHSIKRRWSKLEIAGSNLHGYKTFFCSSDVKQWKEEQRCAWEFLTSSGLPWWLESLVCQRCARMPFSGCRSLGWLRCLLSVYKAITTVRNIVFTPGNLISF